MNLPVLCCLLCLIVISTAITPAKYKDGSIALKRGSPTPEWPDYFTVNWTLYHSMPESPVPPYSDIYQVPIPYEVGHGVTSYNWNTLQMIEKYFDFCVPIFPNHTYLYSCDFLNTNSITYMITYSDRPPQLPPCCVFLKPWVPPPPNFVAMANMTLNGSTPMFWGRGDSEWWALLNTTQNTQGLDASVDDPQFVFQYPFYYGFYAGSNVPSSFVFRGNVGWVQQNFDLFQAIAPPDQVFDIPPACANAQACPMP